MPEASPRKLEVRPASSLSDASPPVGPASPPQSHVWVRISVEDNGCGISEQDQERLFSAFMQVSGGAPLLSRTGALSIPCGRCAVLTLAHGLDEAGAAHAFYGTSKVAAALSRLRGFPEGRVRVRRVVRDAEGHVCGFE